MSSPTDESYIMACFNDDPESKKLKKMNLKIEIRPLKPISIDQQSIKSPKTLAEFRKSHRRKISQQYLPKHVSIQF